MRWPTVIRASASAIMVMGLAGPVLGDGGGTLELTGTIRDFKDGSKSGGHRDFEYSPASYGLRTGIVQSTLGEDRKPVFNTNYNRGNYGYAMITSKATFDQWFRNVDGVNLSDKHTITLTDADGDGIYIFEASIHNGRSFFPLDGKLFGNQGRNHNFHFTYEVHSKFTYSDPSGRQPMVFNFSGDDDVWVFINNKLVVDLGGVHSEVYSSINVDNLAASLGLEPGKTYNFDFFFCERHTTQSNCTISTSIQFLSPLYD